ncbi:MAG: putative selenate reductase subunit YgfK [Candidatus Bipolaricaulota bacterium]
MTCPLRPVAFPRLLDWALSEFKARGSVFGVPAAHAFRPQRPELFQTHRPFGTRLATPLGPAAGPHTQLAQNIVAAWFCGGRFIELKTVQILDDLEIPRPCIDAADEGYNVEWSQELTLKQSAEQYAAAWALVHALADPLDLLPGGVTFNASVGYTLDGVRSARVQAFLDAMTDARPLLNPLRVELRRRTRQVREVDIPDRIVDSVTLSTMHGCPPEEIERIAVHLLSERGLHTIVKLNPTLLGRDRLLGILHGNLGFRDVDVPESAFAHDLAWDGAMDLIAALREAARRADRTFGVKLSNTLAVRNTRHVLPGDEAYLSGRALYPITLALFRQLRDACGNDLPVSFSAGGNEANVVDLIASGACPVTMATDLLKPGGYGRLRSALDALGRTIEGADHASVDEFAAASSARLPLAAAAALEDPTYRRDYVSPDLPKLDSPLPPFDCVIAPCVATCPACQDVPEYIRHLAAGDAEAALAVVLRKNPLPAVTGCICTARCETRCTRANLDQPVRIRDLKRAAAERGHVTLGHAPPREERVAIVGGGPAGLSAATFLAQQGIQVTIYEASSRPGGMPAIAPTFRLPREAVEQDVQRILDLGVTLRLGHPISAPEALLDKGFDAVYVACGLAEDRIPPELDRRDATCVYGALEVLRRVAEGTAPDLGRRVLVIGGGNTAVDAARAALRLARGPVTIVYRRQRADMPADPEEVDAFLGEGGELLLQVAPLGLVVRERRVAGVRCLRTTAGAPEADGRPSFELDTAEPLLLDADSVILAVGQTVPETALAESPLMRSANGRLIPHEDGRVGASAVYAGGDIVRGPATIIEAVADGRRVAETICRDLGIPWAESKPREIPLDPEDEARLQRRRATRAQPQQPAGRPVRAPRDFKPIVEPLTSQQVLAEAERCLQCSEFCDKCVDVCPNRANVAYRVVPFSVPAPVIDPATGVTTRYEAAAVTQTRQVVHVEDLCNECGNCSTFCVHSGRPFLDKPRLRLSPRDIPSAPPGVFALRNGRMLAALGDGQTATLEFEGRNVRYADGRCEIWIGENQEVLDVRPTPGASGEVSTAHAVRLAAMLRGLVASASYLSCLVEPAEGDPSWG